MTTTTWIIVDFKRTTEDGYYYEEGMAVNDTCALRVTWKIKRVTEGGVVGGEDNPQRFYGRDGSHVTGWNRPEHYGMDIFRHRPGLVLVEALNSLSLLLEKEHQTLLDLYRTLARLGMRDAFMEFLPLREVEYLLEATRP
jgi:hypothetical protein